jgi:peptidoglycan/LPS O-acetylase OafA/YrhL
MPASRTHELDGLRGVAIALVITLHTVVEFVQRISNRLGLRYVGDAVLEVTWSGLELFFVLSGTLLLTPYIQSRRPLRTPSYFARRVQRLWPPYLIALIFGGLVVMIARAHLTWYSGEVIPHFSIGGWAAQLGIVNFGWTTYNGAWWSLTMEVCFYLIIPLLVIALALTRSPRGAHTFVAFVVLATLASFVLARNPPRLDAFEYLPSFLFGMLIARFDMPIWLGRALIGVGAVMALLAIANPDVNYHAAFGAIWAGVIIIATRGASRLRVWLSESHLVWLGERSYSLYLVHFSVFYLVDYIISLVIPGRTAVFDVVSRVVGVPLALLAAICLFRFVERRAARGLATSDAFWPWNVEMDRPPDDGSPN